MLWQHGTGLSQECLFGINCASSWRATSELRDSPCGGNTSFSGASRRVTHDQIRRFAQTDENSKCSAFFCCRFSESIGSFVKRTRSTFLCIIGKGGNDRVINSQQPEVSPSPAAHNKRKHGAHSFSKAQFDQCLAIY